MLENAETEKIKIPLQDFGKFLENYKIVKFVSGVVNEL